TRTPEEVFTPEDFSEQHVLIGQTAEEFAQKEIVPNIEKMEHKDFSVTRDLLKKAGELGLSGVEIPEIYGGMELDKVSAAVIAAPALRCLQTESITSSTAEKCGLPMPALPTRSPYSPKWTGKSSPHSWSSATSPVFPLVQKSTRWAFAGLPPAPLS